MSFFHDRYMHATPDKLYPGHVFRFGAGTAIAFDAKRLSIYIFGARVVNFNWARS